MSTFALKITALILMFLDHAGLYFEGAPMWISLHKRPEKIPASFIPDEYFYDLFYLLH